MNRSFHFVPAHRTDFLEKMSSLNADHYILDLEDGVPAAEKDQARYHIAQFLDKSNPSLPQRCFIRMNTVSDEAFIQDLKCLNNKNFFGFVLPKIESLQRLNELKTLLKKDHAKPIIVLIESFKAFTKLDQILSISNLYACGFGLEDLLTEIPLLKEEATPFIDFIRQQLSFQARAHHVVAIDASMDLSSSREASIKEANLSWRLGFHGMFTIHPSQIEVVNQCFVPSEKAQKWAKEVLESAKGTDEPGYYREADQLISPPNVKKAKKIIEASKESS